MSLSTDIIKTTKTSFAVVMCFTQSLSLTGINKINRTDAERHTSP